jgi:hypothetical protein
MLQCSVAATNYLISVGVDASLPRHAARMRVVPLSETGWMGSKPPAGVMWG